MNKYFFLLLSFSFLINGHAQTKVGDAVLPNSETFENQKMVLNGAGTREKFWIDLYAAGLYLKAKSQNAEAIMSAKEPMAIKLHIVSKLITSKKMMDAVNKGFEKSTKGNTAPIQNQIDSILSFFKEDIKKDDVFDLVYLPEKGVIAYKNGVERGRIKGIDFKKALFGIWLSNNPAGESLKKGLLGV